MLRDQNPLSLMVMAEYLRRSKRLTLKEVYQMDYHMSQKYKMNLIEVHVEDRFFRGGQVGVD